MKNAVVWYITQCGFLRSVRPLLATNVIRSSPILATLMMEALRSARNVGSYKSHMA
jgi:hypothetical protein